MVVTRSQVITLPNTTLRAGDADGDGAVGVGDLALVGANFGKAKDFAPAADLNGDGVMNILDLVLVAGNLGKSGTQPW